MNAEQIRRAQALLACPEESVSSIARMLGASRMVTRLPLGTHHSPAVSLKTWASGTEKFQFPVPDKYRICANPMIWRTFAMCRSTRRKQVLI